MAKRMVWAEIVPGFMSKVNKGSSAYWRAIDDRTAARVVGQTRNEVLRKLSARIGVPVAGMRVMGSIATGE